MNIGVPAVVPRSTLPPLALQHKFQSAQVPVRRILLPPAIRRRRLAGLGQCPDETGYDPCAEADFSSYASDAGLSTDDLSSAISDLNTLAPQVGPDAVGLTANAASASTIYADAQGNLIVPGSSGYSSISPSGAVSNATGTRPAASSATITPAQAALWGSVVSSLTRAGVQIAAVTSGASILPNGMIVGQGRSLSTTSLATMFSNPMVIFGVAAVLGLVLVMSSQR